MLEEEEEVKNSMQENCSSDDDDDDDEFLMPTLSELNYLSQSIVSDEENNNTNTYQESVEQPVTESVVEIPTKSIQSILKQPTTKVTIKPRFETLEKPKLLETKQTNGTKDFIVSGNDDDENEDSSDLDAQLYASDPHNDLSEEETKNDDNDKNDDDKTNDQKENEEEEEEQQPVKQLVEKTMEETMGKPVEYITFDSNEKTQSRFKECKDVHHIKPQYVIPEGIIDGLGFGLLTDHELGKRSVFHISDNPASITKKKHAILDSANDPRLGAVLGHYACSTCGDDSLKCQGHNGALKLTNPCAIGSFIRVLNFVCTIFCLHCSAILVPENNPKIKMLRKMDVVNSLGFYKALRIVYKESLRYRVCGQEIPDNIDIDEVEAVNKTSKKLKKNCISIHDLYKKYDDDHEDKKHVDNVSGSGVVGSGIIEDDSKKDIHEKPKRGRKRKNSLSVSSSSSSIEQPNKETEQQQQQSQTKRYKQKETSEIKNETKQEGENESQQQQPQSKRGRKRKEIINENKSNTTTSPSTSTSTSSTTTSPLPNRYTPAEMIERQKKGLKGCGTLNPIVWKRLVDVLIRPIWGQKNPPKVTMNDVMIMLRNVSDADNRLIGLNAPKATVAAFVMNRMIISPMMIRPPRNRRTQDDLTQRLEEIIKVNHSNKTNPRSGNLSLTVHDTKRQCAGTKYFEVLGEDEYTTEDRPRRAPNAPKNQPLVPKHLAHQFELNRQKAGYTHSNLNKKKDLDYGREKACISDAFNRSENGDNQGMIRGKITGKRSNLTARGPISPNTDMDADQIGVPIWILQNLTRKYTVTRYNYGEMMEKVLRANNYPGANKITRDGIDYQLPGFSDSLKIGDIVHCHLTEKDWVGVNRQPSLHKYSLLSHQILPMKKGLSIRLSDLVTVGYAADYDGDEMTLYVFPDDESLAESELMRVGKNMFRNGKLIVQLIQHAVLGCFKLTKFGVFITREYAQQLLYMSKFEEWIFKRINNIPLNEWPLSGRKFLSIIIGPMFYNGDKQLKKDDINDILGNMIRWYGHLSSWGEEGRTGIRLMSAFCRMFNFYAELNNTSLSYNDIYVPKSQLLLNEIDSIKNDIYSIEKERDRLFLNKYQTSSLYGEEAVLYGKCEEHIRLLIEQIKDRISTHVQLYMSKKDPIKDQAAYDITLSGAKGNIHSLLSIAGMLGQQRKRNGGRIDILSTHEIDSLTKHGLIDQGLTDGLNAIQTYYHSAASRDGLVDGAILIKKIGYLFRQMYKALEDCIICYDNSCRTQSGQIIVPRFGFHTTYLNNVSIKSLSMNTMEEWIKHYYYPFGNLAELELQSILHVRTCILQLKKDIELEVSLPIKWEYLKEVYRECSQEGYHYCQTKDESDPGRFADMIRVLVNQSWKDFVTNQYLPSNDLILLSFREHLCTRNLIVNIGVKTMNQVTYILKHVHHELISNLCELGMPIGPNVAQDFHSPAEQMALKSFHRQGVDSQLNGGLSRIEELLHTQTKIKTPSMELFPIDQLNFDPLTILQVRLIDLVDNGWLNHFPDEEEPEEDIIYEQPVDDHDVNEDEDKKYEDEEEHNDVTNDDGSSIKKEEDEQEQPPPLSQQQPKDNVKSIYVITCCFILRKSLMIERKISPRQVCDFILQHPEILLQDIISATYSKLDDELWWVALQMKSTSQFLSSNKKPKKISNAQRKANVLKKNCKLVSNIRYVPKYSTKKTELEKLAKRKQEEQEKKEREIKDAEEAKRILEAEDAAERAAKKRKEVEEKLIEDAEIADKLARQKGKTATTLHSIYSLSSSSSSGSLTSSGSGSVNDNNGGDNNNDDVKHTENNNNSNNIDNTPPPFSQIVAANQQSKLTFLQNYQNNQKETELTIQKKEKKGCVLLNQTKASNLYYKLVIRDTNRLFSGVSGITDIFESKKEVNIIKEDEFGNLTFHKEMRRMIVTKGSNLFEISRTDDPSITWHQHFLTNLTCTNNIIGEIYELYGIDAAAKAIEDELCSLMLKNSASVARSHVNMIASFMCVTGRPTPITFSGMVASGANPLKLCLYEKVVPGFLKAAITGLKTKIEGLSESVLVGKEFSVGTGSVKLMAEDGVQIQSIPNQLPLHGPKIIPVGAKDQFLKVNFKPSTMDYIENGGYGQPFKPIIAEDAKLVDEYGKKITPARSNKNILHLPPGKKRAPKVSTYQKKIKQPKPEKPPKISKRLLKLQLKQEQQQQEEQEEKLTSLVADNNGGDNEKQNLQSNKGIKKLTKKLSEKVSEKLSEKVLAEKLSEKVSEKLSEKVSEKLSEKVLAEKVTGKVTNKSVQCQEDKDEESSVNVVAPNVIPNAAQLRIAKLLNTHFDDENTNNNDNDDEEEEEKINQMFSIRKEQTKQQEEKLKQEAIQKHREEIEYKKQQKKQKKIQQQKPHRQKQQIKKEGHDNDIINDNENNNEKNDDVKTSKQPIKQPTKQLTKQPVKQSMKEPMKHNNGDNIKIEEMEQKPIIDMKALAESQEQELEDIVIVQKVKKRKMNQDQPKVKKPRTVKSSSILHPQKVIQEKPKTFRTTTVPIKEPEVIHWKYDDDFMVQSLSLKLKNKKEMQTNDTTKETTNAKTNHGEINNTSNDETDGEQEQGNKSIISITGAIFMIGVAIVIIYG